MSDNKTQVTKNSKDYYAKGTPAYTNNLYCEYKGIITNTNQIKFSDAFSIKNLI